MGNTGKHPLITGKHLLFIEKQFNREKDTPGALPGRQVKRIFLISNIHKKIQEENAY